MTRNLPPGPERSYPRLRWAGIAAALLEAAGLLAMNYHFVGDIIAGSFVGGIVGTYLAHACGVGDERRDEFR